MSDARDSTRVEDQLGYRGTAPVLSFPKVNHEIDVFVEELAPSDLMSYYLDMTTQSNKLIPLEAMAHAAECLKTLAHPCRLRMIEMLLNGEHTVGKLAETCEIPSHMASEHLGIMRDRGLLESERRGRNVYYRVAEDGLVGIMECISKRFGP